MSRAEMPGVGSGRNKHSEAHAFLLWRAGQSLGWRCTYLELATAAGGDLTPQGARYVCKQRGWRVEPPGPVPVDFDPLAVDVVFERELGFAVAR